MKKSLKILTGFMLLNGVFLSAQDSYWSFEFSGGLPYNFTTPLTIQQANEPTLRINARYRSEPFRSPIYYLWRIGRWQDKRAWELEFVHHKLFLENRPPEVQEFSISHGLNMVLVNRAFEKQLLQKYPFILRLGAGIILAHPENTVRGQSLDQEGGLFGWGYYISGPVLNVSLAKRFYLLEKLYINTEFKFNPSVSWVPVANGQATVWNLPVAIAFGMGFDLGNRKNGPD
jgi:hypothetical protein